MRLAVYVVLLKVGKLLSDEGCLLCQHLHRLVGTCQCRMIYISILGIEEVLNLFELQLVNQIAKESGRNQIVLIGLYNLQCAVCNALLHWSHLGLKLLSQLLQLLLRSTRLASLVILIEERLQLIVHCVKLIVVSHELVVLLRSADCLLHHVGLNRSAVVEERHSIRSLLDKDAQQSVFLCSALQGKLAGCHCSAVA